MKILCAILFLVPVALLATAALAQARPDTLTPQEIAAGWLLLFDRNDSTPGGDHTFGWKVQGEAGGINGVLMLGGTRKTTMQTTTGFGQFEAQLEFQCEESRPGSRLPRLYWQGEDAWVHLPLTEHIAVLRINTEKEVCELSLNAGETKTLKIDGRPQRGAVAPAPIAFHVPVDTRLFLRSLKLRPLGLRSIFNGRDLAGWKEIHTARTQSKFTVTPQGWLNIHNGPGDLQTQEQWDDFVLQLDVLSNGDHLNSGVFFRCIPGAFWSGYEAQIRNEWKGNDRTQPIDYGTGGIYNRQPARKVVSSDREWFTMTVAAQGKHLAVWVNGYQTADFTDLRPANDNARKGCKTGKGAISLQGHDRTTDLSFRNIRIAPLPRSAP